MALSQAVTAQEAIRETPRGGAALLGGGELRGPIEIDKPLLVEGEGCTIWAPVGPVVRIRSDGVTLRHLCVHVTGIGPATANVAIESSSSDVRTYEVEVFGEVVGIDAEAGAWHYPRTLSLGTLQPGEAHHFLLELIVPVTCTLTSTIAGLDVRPRRLEPGRRRVEIVLDREIQPETILHGKILIHTARFRRAITLTGVVRNAGTVPSMDPVLIWAPDGIPEMMRAKRERRVWHDGKFIGAGVAIAVALLVAGIICAVRLSGQSRDVKKPPDSGGLSQIIAVSISEPEQAKEMILRLVARGEGARAEEYFSSQGWQKSQDAKLIQSRPEHDVGWEQAAEGYRHAAGGFWCAAMTGRRERLWQAGDCLQAAAFCAYQAKRPGSAAPLYREAASTYRQAEAHFLKIGRSEDATTCSANARECEEQAAHLAMPKAE